MVWKCCVLRCKSSSKIPVHRFPTNRERAESWLRIIGRIDKIGVPEETLVKLRICTDHFSEDMVVPYGSIRRLKDNALPNQNLPEFDIVQNDANINSEIQIMEDQDNPDLVSNLDDIVTDEQTPIPSTSGQIRHRVQQKRQTSQKKKSLRKLLYKKKVQTRKLKEQIKRLRNENVWEKVTKNMSDSKDIYGDD